MFRPHRWFQAGAFGVILFYIMIALIDWEVSPGEKAPVFALLAVAVLLTELFDPRIFRWSNVRAFFLALTAGSSGWFWLASEAEKNPIVEGVYGLTWVSVLEFLFALMFVGYFVTFVGYLIRCRPFD